MPKGDLTKIFFAEIYSNLSRKEYPTKIITYNHIDHISSIDFADFSGYKISDNRMYRSVLVVIEYSSKYLWNLKIEFSKTVGVDISYILTTSK